MRFYLFLIFFFSLASLGYARGEREIIQLGFSNDDAKSLDYCLDEFKNALCYEHGIGVWYNAPRAFLCYRNAAWRNSGDIRHYAFEYLQKESDENDFDAKYQLGWFYAPLYPYDEHDQCNYRRGNELKKDIFKLRYDPATLNEAYSVITKSNGIHKKSFETLRKYAEQGYYPSAQYAFAQACCIYRDYAFAKPYLKDIVKYLEKAFDAGIYKAGYPLGVFHFFGLYTPEDKERALLVWEKTFSMAFSKKTYTDPKIIKALVCCYYNGYGRTYDKNKAFDLYSFTENYPTDKSFKERFNDLVSNDFYPLGLTRFEEWKLPLKKGVIDAMKAEIISQERERERAKEEL